MDLRGRVVPALINWYNVIGCFLSRLSLLREDMAMPVPMELSRIIISEINDQQVIYLKEIDGQRTFPILIGIFEATSIDRRGKRFHPPRPLTHDLLVGAVEMMGGEFQDVVINELREHTYFAKLRIRHDGELLEIDARPSDAIALALRTGTRVFVEESVMQSIKKDADTGVADVGRLQKWLEGLSDEELGKYKM